MALSVNRAVLALAACMSFPAAAAGPVKVGPEIEVSSDDAGYDLRVGADAAGNFMVTWNVYDAVYGRRFFATGQPQGPEFRVSDPDHETGSTGFTDRGLHDVEADAAGNFAVAWFAYAEEEPCSARGCSFVRQVDAKGKLGNAFVVGDPTYGPWADLGRRGLAANPELAVTGQGTFIVAWEGYDLDPEGVFARRTTAIGQPIGGAFRVNATQDGYQAEEGELDIAADADGNFVVTWCGYSDQGGAYPFGGMNFQRFDAQGQPVGPETQFAKWSYGDPRIARAPDGSFMIAWTESPMMAAVFAPDGTPLTDNFELGFGDEHPNIAASENAFVVVASHNDYVYGQIFDLLGSDVSGVFKASTTPDGYAPDVATAANGDFIVTWTDGYRAVAQRFQVETPMPVEQALPGKKLLLKNVLPDDPAKNLAKWKSKAPSLVVPARGTASDPRCNGDAPGTVKATLEFSSPSSGHGSGVQPLPCQNWIATGGNKVSQVAKRGYRYKDSKLVDGGCQVVKITGTKTVSVTCKGKGAGFPYDLEPGTSEGVVHAVLEMGLHRYCAAFDGATGKDGSDGRKFQVANTPAPAGCP